MNDLDWLARNVHVWPENTPHVISAGGSVFEHGATFCEKHVCIYDRDFTNSKIIYKLQWLARRAELQNKPSWDTSPKWARSLFQNFDGRWFWVEFSTDKNGDSFWTLALGSSGKQKYASSGEVLGDWRDTLEKRPKSDDAKIDDTPIGRIEGSEYVLYDPFVRVEDAATAKQPAPKGSGNPILGMVLADLTNRALEGKEKYGEPLLAHNGRNPLWDAYQEALDLAMYLRQAIEEQK